MSTLEKIDEFGHKRITLGSVEADIYAILANIATMSNLAMGLSVTISILFFKPFTSIVMARLISIGAGFDAVDGKLARRSSTKPKLGPQFDTAADQITFATAPSLLIYLMLSPSGKVLALIMAFLYFFTASFRLSRFMISPTHGYFSGMPSPVAAFFIVGWYLQPQISAPLLAGSVVFISLIMISSMPYSAFRNVRSNYQRFYWIFTVSIMLLTSFGPSAWFGVLGDIWIYYIIYFGIVGPKHARHNMRIDDELGITKKNKID